MMSQTIPKRTRAEIDLGAVRENFKIVRAHIGNRRICCVVKANAYGHGAVALSRVYEELGADFLAVSGIEEALQLRRAQIRLPILILGYTAPECASVLAEQNISQCVYSAEYGSALAESAASQGVRVKIHIKMDTGMGRIGFSCREEGNASLQSAADLCKHAAMIPEGIFTHLSSASDGENGDAFTRRQLRDFDYAIAYFRAHGVSFSIRHAANSGATLGYPEAHLDMVRVGILLYGYSPSDQLRKVLGLTPVLQLKTTVVHLKTVRAGDTVGYSRAFTADREMRLATIPIGYADGFWRANAVTSPTLELAGAPVPIVGGICMDQCVLDVSAIGDVKIGDTVTVYGTRDYNSVEHIARCNQTIPYEILCAIGERVPRIYLDGDRIASIIDPLLS